MIGLFKRKENTQLKREICELRNVIEQQKHIIKQQEKELNDYKDNYITLHNILEARANLIEQTGKYPKRVIMSKKIYTNLNRERLFLEALMYKGNISCLLGMSIIVKDNIEGWYVK
ncbi:MAG: hypothetical protein ACOCRK_11215 [bacterium]